MSLPPKQDITLWAGDTDAAARMFTFAAAALPAFDFTGTWRVVAIIGLTPEYVDLTTNYWNVGNTFSYVAIGRLAD